MNNFQAFLPFLIFFWTHLKLESPKLSPSCETDWFLRSSGSGPQLWRLGNGKSSSGSNRSNSRSGSGIRSGSSSGELSLSSGNPPSSVSGDRRLPWSSSISSNAKSSTWILISAGSGLLGGRSASVWDWYLPDGVRDLWLNKPVNR